MNIIEEIRKILLQRKRQLHGECCAYCHGSGSNKTCPNYENDPGPTDTDMIWEIMDLLEEKENENTSSD